MPKQLFLNNFTSTFIANVKDAATTGTPATELGYGILQLNSGATTSLINPTGGDYYVLTAYKRSGSVESNVEIMKVTAVDNSVINECRITVLRAQDGTSAQAYVPGDYISLRFTKGGAENLVQRDSTETLTNKTLTSPTLTSPAVSSGNLNFSGTGQKIMGNFGGGTLANRVMVQTNTTNDVTELNVIPSGTGAESYLTLNNSSDPTNAARFYMTAKAAEARIEASKLGTGSYLPVTVWTSGSEKFRIAADATGTYTFGGTAPRITGDFSNAAVANRVMFQTSTVNGSTFVGAVPNGTGSSAEFTVFGLSDPTNSPIGALDIPANTEVRLRSGRTGTGTYLPMTFYTGGSERMRIGTDGTITVPNLNGGPLAGFRNRIINGDMRIAQRGTSFSATGATLAYPVDRFGCFATGGVFTLSKETDAPPGTEFSYSARFTVTTADTAVAATDNGAIFQIIEGYNVRDLIGRTFTLSFWVRSSKTGIHCAAFRNTGNDRSYVVEYTITSANTWERKTVTVPGGLITAGTWDWTNGAGLVVIWTLYAGTSYQSTAGSWVSSTSQSTANQPNLLDTVGNVFAITGVQLEPGPVATPFEQRPYGVELSLCQRYYYRAVAVSANDAFCAGFCNATTTATGVVQFPVQMRVAPSALEQNGTAADYRIVYSNTVTNCSSVPVFGSSTTQAGRVIFTVASGLTLGQGAMVAASSASAYLGFSAEL